MQPEGDGGLDAMGKPRRAPSRGLSLRHAGRGRPRHLGGPSSSLSHEGQGRPPARDDRSRGRREGGSRRAAYERGRRGNGLAPGPGRAKAARVGVSFRRDPAAADVLHNIVFCGWKLAGPHQPADLVALYQDDMRRVVEDCLRERESLPTVFNYGGSRDRNVISYLIDVSGTVGDENSIRVLPQSTVGVLSLTYLHARVWAVV